ncbi:MAG: 5'-methylthioadenosine/adenosylhomocysteine nucleosidase [Bacteroidales bacterium]|nr:5'-methylthioadenosine/adenosylhomocysteine nucleosidase [Candidatus Scybalousia scybalohippi]
MTVGIIIAMSKEFAEMESILQNKKTNTKGNYTYVEGTLKDKHIILQHSGIGKVNAALGCENLINTYSPDIVLSTGVAGGASNDLEIMDIVASTSCVYHDVYCGMENSYGQIQGMPEMFQTPEAIIDCVKKVEGEHKIHTGLIVTGDWFVDTTDKMREILSHFPQAMAVDMESCAIAHTCFLHNTPFLSLRIISDIPLKEGNKKQYDDFWAKMAEGSFNTTKKIIEKL